MIYQLFNSIEKHHYHFSIYNSFNFISHFHEYFEVIYVIEGDITITVNSETKTFFKDDIALILPNQIHSFKTEKSSVTWISLFSQDLILQFANDTKDKIGTDFKLSCPVDQREYFAKSMPDVNMENIYELKAFLYTICSIYVKNIELIPKVIKSDLTFTHKIIEYISTHFQENINQKQLALMFGYNQNYLSRYFNKVIGMNFKRFLNEFRIQYAKSKLLETNMSISDIAHESGFDTIRNFNRVFTSIEGMTPSEFKRI